MSDYTPAPETGNPPANAVQIIWIFYLVGIVVSIAAIGGLIWAYVMRNETDPSEWEHSHFTFQIRTFWIGLLYSVISLVLAVILIGFLLLLVALAWYVVRCVKGLIAHGKQEPIPNPRTWLW